MGETDLAELAVVQKRLVESAKRTYATREERSALRCALGDATALCDWLTGQIERENKGRGAGGITKHGRELSAVSRRCADIIFAMRDMVSTEIALPSSPPGMEIEE